MVTTSPVGPGFGLPTASDTDPRVAHAPPTATQSTTGKPTPAGSFGQGPVAPKPPASWESYSPFSGRKIFNDPISAHRAATESVHELQRHFPLYRQYEVGWEVLANGDGTFRLGRLVMGGLGSVDSNLSDTPPGFSDSLRAPMTTQPRGHSHPFGGKPHYSMRDLRNVLRSWPLGGERIGAMYDPSAQQGFAIRMDADVRVPNGLAALGSKPKLSPADFDECVKWLYAQLDSGKLRVEVLGESARSPAARAFYFALVCSDGRVAVFSPPGRVPQDTASLPNTKVYAPPNYRVTVPPGVARFR